MRNYCHVEAMRIFIPPRPATNSLSLDWSQPMNIGDVSNPVKILSYALLAGYASYVFTTGRVQPRLTMPSDIAAFESASAPQTERGWGRSVDMNLDADGYLEIDVKDASLERVIMEISTLTHIRFKLHDGLDKTVSLEAKAKPEEIIGRLLRDADAFYYYRSQQGQPKLEAVWVFAPGALPHRQ
jgi:hypothetical protein